MPLNERGRGQAIVIGGSMAGLLSARVLSEHFEKVIILERDRLPEGPEARKSAPQARHIHALLEAGLKALDELFPTLVRELVREGSDLIDMARDAAWFQSGSWKVRYEGGPQTILVSRPFLEWKVRGQVTALPNVELRQGYGVEELLMDASRTRVTGVKVAGPEGEQTLEGELVVDTSGRGSRAPQWLEALGYGRPEEEQVGIELGYTSRFYERPAGFDEWKILAVSGRAPESRRAGFIANVEGGRWIVSLNGYFGDHAPTDDAGFLEFARGLPTPHIHEYIRHAKPLTPAVSHKIPTSRWMHYETMARFPEGFVLLGDTVCSLNPVFGQGMTVISLGARLLGEHVARARTSPGGLRQGLARGFQKELGKIVGLCWFLTTTMDLAYPEARGKRPFGLKAVQWSVQNMIDLTSLDAKSCHAFYEVLHMRKGMEGLLQPGFAAALMAYNLKSLLVPREQRANLTTLPPPPGRSTPPAPPAAPRERDAA
ncbi:NAD(P)/FAD-dependent oxidoreductase [Archangium gephyra]|uniref:NAD(P)/FAD-dependent oxidoreductase n=1 Tax=Archangium gephyra TaxID=48 RepID=UPI003B75FB74